MQLFFSPIVNLIMARSIIVNDFVDVTSSEISPYTCKNNYKFHTHSHVCLYNCVDL